MSIVDRQELGVIFDWSAEQIDQALAHGLPVHQRDTAGNAELFDTVKVIDWTASRAVVKRLLEQWQP